MTLEVFGDDGNPPECWEETAMCQEFSKIASEYYSWQRRYKEEMPNERFKAMAYILGTQMEDLDNQMVGPL